MGDIDALCDDVIVEILACMASSSGHPLRELVNVGKTCKRIKTLANDELLFRRVRIDEWSRWEFTGEHVKLFDRCLEAGNPRASHIKGMIEYFDLRRPESGLQYLRKAGEDGLEEACYTLGMILFGLESTRDESIDLLQKTLKNSTAKGLNMKSIRERSSNILQNVWPNYKLPLQDSICEDPACKLVRERRNQMWEEESGEGEEFCSETCMWRDDYNKFVGAAKWK